MDEVTGAWGASEEELDCSSEEQNLPIEPDGWLGSLKASPVSPVVLHPFEPQAMVYSDLMSSYLPPTWQSLGGH